MVKKEIKKSRIGKKSPLPVETSLVDGKTGEVKKLDIEINTEETEPGILYTGLEGKLVLVRVGDDKEEAKDEEIEVVEDKMRELIEGAGIKCLLFVTHHAVDIQVIG